MNKSMNNSYLDKDYKEKLKQYFLDEEYGNLPSFDDVKVSYELCDEFEKAIENKAHRKDIRVYLERNNKITSFGFELFVPKKAKGIFVFICNRPVGKISRIEADPNRDIKSDFYPIEEIINRNYACACFRTSEVAEDKNGFRFGVNSIFSDIDHKDPHSYGTLLLWAKGFSLVIDYLKKDPLTKDLPIATVGHSRGGKTSILCGVLDNRVDLVISSSAGCAGDAEESNYHDEAETIKVITNAFPYWFCPAFKQYAKKKREHDQAEFLSLIAPRLLYTSSKSEDLWADPLGQYETLIKVSKAYEEYGKKGVIYNAPFDLETEQVSNEGNIGHHHLKGIHDLTKRDWNLYMDFWDKHLDK